MNPDFVFKTPIEEANEEIGQEFVEEEDEEEYEEEFEQEEEEEADEEFGEDEDEEEADEEFFDPDIFSPDQELTLDERQKLGPIIMGDEETSGIIAWENPEISSLANVSKVITPGEYFADVSPWDEKDEPCPEEPFEKITIGVETQTQRLTRRQRDAYARSYEQFCETMPELRITEIQLGIYSAEEINDIAVVTVEHTENEFDIGTVNDPHMGSIDSSIICQTCFRTQCGGHFGQIQLSEKNYHPLFIDYIVMVLRSICHSCGELLMSREQIENSDIKYISAMKKRLKKISDESEKIRSCTNENTGVGNIKSCEAHPRYAIAGANKNVITWKKKKNTKEYPLTVEEVYNRLNSISDENAKLLGFKYFHPRDLVLKNLIVIPPSARPPAFDGINYLPDQLTTRYNTIIKLNNDIRQYLDSVKANPNLLHDTELANKYIELKNKLFTEINCLIQGSKQANTKQDIMSLTRRLTGKTGLMRQQLAGKRVECSARTVLGPGGPNLRFGEIGIPRAFQNLLTNMQTVCAYNRNSLQKKLEDGRIAHISRNGITYAIVPGKSYSLRDGDIVYPYLEEGDAIIFNRQPTLGSRGIQKFRVKFHEGNTIQLHPASCKAFNADFDGDEGNAFNVISLKALMEATLLMGAENMIVSDANNRTLQALAMDQILGAFYLSLDSQIDFRQWNDLYELIEDPIPLEELRPKLRKFDIKFNTGKALISAALPPDFNYTRKNTMILEGILVAGSLTSQNVGDSHRSIIQDLYYRYPKSVPAKFITNMSRIAIAYFNSYGYTIGTDECFGTDQIKLQEILREHMEKTFAEYEAIGECSKNPRGPEHHEKQVVETLNIVQGIGVKVVTENLGKSTEQYNLQLSPIASNFNGKILAAIRAWVGQLLLLEEAKTVNKSDAEIKKITLSYDRSLDKLQKLAKRELTEDGVRKLSEILNNLIHSGGNVEDYFFDEKLGTIYKANKYLKREGNIVILSDQVTGTKGTVTNIAQIAASLGQQFYRGKRPPCDITGGTRFLPLFEPNSRLPEARGFCKGSFYGGLDPAELFVHMQCGRAGLTDTALSTATTGTINRRLTLAMSNVVIAVDGSVRFTNGKLVQAIYGNDGFRPNTLIRVDSKQDGIALDFVDISGLADQLNSKFGWYRRENVKNWERLLHKNSGVVTVPENLVRLIE